MPKYGAKIKKPKKTPKNTRVGFFQPWGERLMKKIYRAEVTGKEVD